MADLSADMDSAVGGRQPVAMNRLEFVRIFGGVYEKSPWVAEQAWDQGLTATDNTQQGLCNTLAGIVDGAGKDAQLTLLRAHPDLAGRLAKRGQLTAASASEQAGAGLDQCSPHEYAQFQDLNARYTGKFGFPYILAVRGRDRQQILENFRSRVDNDAEQEFAEALRQVHRIAGLRLQQIGTSSAPA